jgi:hydroxymethylglutaryl-CoA reductase
MYAGTLESSVSAAMTRAGITHKHSCGVNSTVEDRQLTRMTVLNTTDHSALQQAAATRLDSNASNDGSTNAPVGPAGSPRSVEADGGGAVDGR